MGLHLFPFVTVVFIHITLITHISEVNALPTLCKKVKGHKFRRSAEKKDDASRLSKKLTTDDDSDSDGDEEGGDEWKKMQADIDSMNDMLGSTNTTASQPSLDE